MFQHILIPTDGAELSKKAIDAGIALAKTLNARITAYTCLPPYPYVSYMEFVVEPSIEIQQSTQHQAQEHLRQIEARAKEQGVLCHSLCSTHPEPYIGIIDAATSQKCDLILMASHGRRGLGSLVIGSETQRVLTHSKIPVLVYR